APRRAARRRTRPSRGRTRGRRGTASGTDSSTSASSSWLATSRCPLRLEREHPLPFLLHAHHGPAPRLRLVESLVQAADAGLAVIRPFALRVVMVDVETKARSSPRGGPLQHLQVAVGVPEGGDGPAPDELLDTHRLPFLVVHEIHGGQLDEHGLAVANLIPLLACASDDLLGRDAVGLLRKGAEELDPAPG